MYNNLVFKCFDDCSRVSWGRCDASEKNFGCVLIRTCCAVPYSLEVGEQQQQPCSVPSWVHGRDMDAKDADVLPYQQASLVDTKFEGPRYRKILLLIINNTRDCTRSCCFLRGRSPSCSVGSKSTCTRSCCFLRGRSPGCSVGSKSTRNRSYCFLRGRSPGCSVGSKSTCTRSCCFLKGRSPGCSVGSKSTKRLDGAPLRTWPPSCRPRNIVQHAFFVFG